MKKAYTVNIKRYIPQGKSISAALSDIQYLHGEETRTTRYILTRAMKGGVLSNPSIECLCELRNLASFYASDPSIKIDDILE